MEGGSFDVGLASSLSVQIKDDGTDRGKGGGSDTKGEAPSARGRRGITRKILVVCTLLECLKLFYRTDTAAGDPSQKEVYPVKIVLWILL